MRIQARRFFRSDGATGLLPRRLAHGENWPRTANATAGLLDSSSPRPPVGSCTGREPRASVERLARAALSDDGATGLRPCRLGARRELAEDGQRYSRAPRLLVYSSPVGSCTGREPRASVSKAGEGGVERRWSDGAPAPSDRNGENWPRTANATAGLFVSSSPRPSVGSRTGREPRASVSEAGEGGVERRWSDGAPAPSARARRELAEDGQRYNRAPRLLVPSSARARGGSPVPPYQRLARAALSVALGRRAAEALASSGR